MTGVVIDTNILVSALRTPLGNEAAVLTAVRNKAIAAYVTPAVVQEYEEVLRRPKFSFDPTIVDVVLTGFRHVAVPVEPGDAPASPDPTDTKFIACAIAARADFLVTGNRRHFPEPSYGTAAVVNARELLARLRPAC